MSNSTNNFNQDNVPLAFLLVVIAGISTGLGASLVYCTRVVRVANAKVLAASLGFSSGVMLYVSLIEIFQKSYSSFQQCDCLWDPNNVDGTAYAMASVVFMCGILVTMVLDFIVHKINHKYSMVNAARKRKENIKNLESHANHHHHHDGTGGDGAQHHHGPEVHDDVDECCQSPEVLALIKELALGKNLEEQEQMLASMLPTTGSEEDNSRRSSMEREGNVANVKRDESNLLCKPHNEGENENETKKKTSKNDNGVENVHHDVEAQHNSKIAPINEAMTQIVDPATMLPPPTVVQVKEEAVVPASNNSAAVASSKANSEINLHNLDEEKQRKLNHMGVMTALALGLHNFPEGLATFVAALADPAVGVALCVALTIHNIPEGLCVALPIYYATGSRHRGFWLAIFSGIAEIVGALIGYAILIKVFGPTAYAVLFGLVAGMMTYIVVKELLPTAHRYDPNDKVVTFSIIFGIAIMALSLVLFRVA